VWTADFIWSTFAGAITVYSRCMQIVEVKGPGDRLSTKQIVWLDYLTQLGVDAEVCYVKGQSAFALKSILLLSKIRLSFDIVLGFTCRPHNKHQLWGDEGMCPQYFTWEVWPLTSPPQYLTFILFCVVKVDRNDSFSHGWPI